MTSNSLWDVRKIPSCMYSLFRTDIINIEVAYASVALFLSPCLTWWLMSQNASLNHLNRTFKMVNRFIFKTEKFISNFHPTKQSIAVITVAFSLRFLHWLISRRYTFFADHLFQWQFAKNKFNRVELQSYLNDAINETYASWYVCYSTDHWHI